jgi:hypothetical protein
MKLWLDDERQAPAGWVHVKTAKAAIDLIAAGVVAEVSLDHDLGEPEVVVGNGYMVLLAMEAMAAQGQGQGLPREIRIHTANPVARNRMAAARESILRLIAEEDASAV